MSKLIDRYLIKEILSPFWISLSIFTGVLFLIRSIKLIDLVVNKNVPVGDILYLFALLIPRFLEVAIPMALLVAIVVAFGRLSADSELVVLRSVGLSFNRMAGAVLLVASLCAVATLGIGLWLRPWANYELGLGVFTITKVQASSGLVQGVFNDIGQLTLYAERINDDGKALEHVIISDQRDPNVHRVFVARHGQLIADEVTRSLELRLFDGSIEMGAGANYSVTYFDINNIRLDQSDLASAQDSRGKKAEEMFPLELQSAIAIAKQTAEQTVDREQSNAAVHNLRSLLIELHGRFALPFACLCVAFTSMALGVQPSRGGHAWGLVMNIVAGVGVIISYYLLTAVVKIWAEKSGFALGLFVWLPNIGFSVLSWYLFRRLGSERWLAVSDAVGSLFSKMSRLLRTSPAPGKV